MHELSIAQSILHTVQQEMTLRRLPAVTEVGVQVGALSGVLPDALLFGFEALVAGTPLAGCRLALTPVPAEARCRACGHPFAVADFLFRCPACGSGQVDVTHGYELNITHLEVEDPACGERSAGCEKAPSASRPPLPGCLACNANPEALCPLP
jgi:hydrogenase nickel incorporation protein HypA/HybF